MDKMKKIAPDLMAKKDVLMALNRLAKQMMVSGHDEEMESDEGMAPEQADKGALIADLTVKKVKPMKMDMDEEMEDDSEDEKAPGFDGMEDVSEEGDDEEDEDDMSMNSIKKLLR